MIKYPIGIQSFEKIISDGYLYVDKTALIYQIVTEGNIYFLSRPRRFGKSLLVSTLENYFLGRKELFKGLAMEGLEENWYEYPVFHIDFNSVNFSEPGTLEKVLEGAVGTWEQKFGRSAFYDVIGKRFAHVLHEAHMQTGRRCVVLIDEYDKPLLDVLDSDMTIRISENERKLEEWNREVLKGFYSVFKEADNDLQFVLLTGVTKFSQVSVFSGFNQPDDISMDARYEALCGITQQELETYFAEPISQMAEEFGVSPDEMKSMLKAKYDGYHFSPKMLDIYNPFSLLNAFAKKQLDDWWFRSGTPTYLMRLLAHSGESLDDLTGKYYELEEFIDYKADVEKPLPMIYQSGYLTIKDYDRETNAYLLDFPNKEVAKGFLALTASSYFKNDGVRGFARDMQIALSKGNTERVRDLLTSFLADIPYELRESSDAKLKEKHFQYTLYLIFRFLGTYVVDAEKHSSQGRADCIVRTPKYIWIFEFKLDGDASQALSQIDERGYAKPFAADSRTIIKIGVNFSSKTGTIEGWEM